jgi:tetratricopeptide (TPR) repeat protein
MMRAGWSVRQRLTTALAELHARSLTVPKSAIAALHDVRLVRSLLAIENLLGYFSAAALPKTMSSAPLDLIRGVLQANGLGDEQADLAVEQTLQSLVKEHPEYAEFWLELGYLRVDQNRVDEALDCYARAASGRAIIVAPQDGTAHPSIQARINAARIMADRGDFTAARREYAVALALANGQSMAHIEYGLLLRKDGQTDKALAHFAAGTGYDWPSWPVPKAGRDVTKLSFPNLVRPSVQVAIMATAAE